MSSRNYLFFLGGGGGGGGGECLFQSRRDHSMTTIDHRKSNQSIDTYRLIDDQSIITSLSPKLSSIAIDYHHIDYLLLSSRLFWIALHVVPFYCYDFCTGNMSQVILTIFDECPFAVEIGERFGLFSRP